MFLKPIEEQQEFLDTLPLLQAVNPEGTLAFLSNGEAYRITNKYTERGIETEDVSCSVACVVEMTLPEKTHWVTYSLEGVGILLPN